MDALILPDRRKVKRWPVYVIEPEAEGEDQQKENNGILRGSPLKKR